MFLIIAHYFNIFRTYVFFMEWNFVLIIIFFYAWFIRLLFLDNLESLSKNNILHNSMLWKQCVFPYVFTKNNISYFDQWTMNEMAPGKIVLISLTRQYWLNSTYNHHFKACVAIFIVFLWFFTKFLFHNSFARCQNVMRKI